MGIVKGIAGLIDSVIAKGLSRVGSRGAKDQAKPAGEGFFVGNLRSELPGEAGEPVFLFPSERRKHLYVLGSTGCGKTNLLLRLIDEEVREERTCVVVDLRGDLVDRVLTRLCSGEGEWTGRLRLIDLREDGFVTPFNLLSGSGDVYSRAFHLLGVLRHNAESWGVQLEETLRNSLIALAEAGRSLLDIEPLLDDSAFREAVLSGGSDPHVQAFFDRYGALSSEKQLAWSLPVLNKITPLLSIPQLRRMLGAGDGFGWSESLDTPGRIVLIALAAHRFHGAAHLLGGLLVSSLQSAVMARASVAEDRRNPVTLFIDEFETMASESFASIIAEGRRFGLSLVLSHQNLAQLDAGLRQVIRNNVHAQLFFQTGASDAADLASDIAGSEPKEAVRSALGSQAVGEAFLVRRGRESIQVVTPLSADPAGNEHKAEELKRSVLEAHCVPAAKEMTSRARSTNPQDAPSQSREVRHERKPRTHKPR